MQVAAADRRAGHLEHHLVSARRRSRHLAQLESARLWCDFEQRLHGGMLPGLVWRGPNWRRYAWGEVLNARRKCMRSAAAEPNPLRSATVSIALEPSQSLTGYRS